MNLQRFGELMVKVGTVVGAVLLIFDFSVLYYSPATGTVTLFDNPAGRVLAILIAAMIFMGLVLFLLPGRGSAVKP